MYEYQANFRNTFTFFVTRYTNYTEYAKKSFPILFFYSRKKFIIMKFSLSLIRTQTYLLRISYCREKKIEPILWQVFKQVREFFQFFHVTQKKIRQIELKKFFSQSRVVDQKILQNGSLTFFKKINGRQKNNFFYSELKRAILRNSYTYY